METKHLLTNVDCSTDTTVRWTKNTHKPDFFKSGKNHKKRKNSKNIYKYAKISYTPFHQKSLIHREALFMGGPKIPKNLFFKEKL